VAGVAESIRQSELRNNNAEIMRRVAEGESFTVTVHGRAVADLVPHRRTTSRRRLVPAAELDELLALSGPAPDPGRWSRDTAEADVLFGDDHPSDPWDRDGQR
jgi:prevent-host-death family protein